MSFSLGGSLAVFPIRRSQPLADPNAGWKSLSRRISNYTSNGKCARPFVRYQQSLASVNKASKPKSHGSPVLAVTVDLWCPESTVLEASVAVVSMASLGPRPWRNRSQDHKHSRIALCLDQTKLHWPVLPVFGTIMIYCVIFLLSL